VVSDYRWSVVDMIEKVAEQCSTLDDFVVLSFKMPNAFNKVACKHNLEELNRYAEKRHLLCPKYPI
jgi:hypothetical protein